MNHFRVDTQHGDALVRLTCWGELDVGAARVLQESFEEALRSRPRSLHLDASEVTFISAAGITMLVDLIVACRDSNVEAQVDLSEHVRAVLDMVGLWWLGLVDDGIAIHESLQRALRSYADQQLEARSAPRPRKLGA